MIQNFLSIPMKYHIYISILASGISVPGEKLALILEYKNNVHCSERNAVPTPLPIKPNNLAARGNKARAVSIRSLLQMLLEMFIDHSVLLVLTFRSLCFTSPYF